MQCMFYPPPCPKHPQGGRERCGIVLPNYTSAFAYAVPSCVHSVARSVRQVSSPLVLLRLRAHARVPLAHFRRGGIAEVLDLEQWPDLDLAFLLVRIGAALDPVDRLLKRRHFPQPEAGNELLGLGEGAVGDSAILAREAHARALARRLQALACKHDAGLH